MTDRDFLFVAMRQKYPDGNKDAQLRFCHSVAEERIQIYARAFSEVSPGKSRKQFVIKP